MNRDANANLKQSHFSTTCRGFTTWSLMVPSARLNNNRSTDWSISFESNDWEELLLRPEHFIYFANIYLG